MHKDAGAQETKVHMVLFANYRSLIPPPTDIYMKQRKTPVELVKQHLDWLERLVEYSVGHERKNDRQ